MSHRCPACRQELPYFIRHGVMIRGDVGSVTRDNVTLRLRPSLLMVFECLADAHPKAISPDEIFDTLYSDRAKQPKPGVVKVFISELRRELSTIGIRIVGFSGYGYRLEFDGYAKQEAA